MPRFERVVDAKSGAYVAVFISQPQSLNGRWSWQIQGRVGGHGFLDSTPTFLGNAVFAGFKTWQEAWQGAKSALRKRLGETSPLLADIEREVTDTLSA